MMIVVLSLQVCTGDFWFVSRISHWYIKEKIILSLLSQEEHTLWLSVCSDTRGSLKCVGPVRTGAGHKDAQ